jgi:acetyl-CoA acetyltransferase
MSRSPLHNIAVVGLHNTRQARTLEGEDSLTVTMRAAIGAVKDAGIELRDVDGVISPLAADVVYQSRIGPAWCETGYGIPAILSAAAAISTGLATVVLVCDGSAGRYRERSATAPWTRPANEFVASYGMFTAPEFALIARRHMHLYGTTPESLAVVASTIRNNGHLNPEAVYFQRGPFEPNDILTSRMVCDPFHLLDCATTTEGGCALVLARGDVARDLRKPPIWIIGAGMDRFGPSYQYPPTFDLGGARRPDLINGWVGRRAVERALEASGIQRSEIDVFELYDPFSFEIIRQFESFGFCSEGEGGDFVVESVGPDRKYQVSTDGGTMSYSHTGSAQLLQRVGRGVQQLRGECPTIQVEGATVALCTGAGAGALATDVILLGSQRP